MSGHTKHKCYKLVGYPAHFFKKKAAVVTQTDEKECNNLVKDDNISITANQYDLFVQMMNQQKQKPAADNDTPDYSAHVAGTHCFTSWSNTSWIIDTASSDHMCHDLSFFTTYKMTHANNHIAIPNGKQVKVTHIGTIYLNNGIELQSVLFVPDFKFNLISIPKLCKDLNCSAIFINDTCI